MKKKQKNEILFFIIFASFIIGFSQINFDSAEIQKENYKMDMIPNVSNDIINSSRVFIDREIVHRGIETLNITYNNTANNGDDFLEEDTYYFMANITFSNSSEQYINLTRIEPTHIWTTLFTPTIFNVTGDTNIAILAMLILDDSILNTDATSDQTFEIANNLPKVGIVMNTTEVYRNKTIKIDYLPSDIENNVMDLKWKVELFDPTDYIEANITLVAEGEKNFSSEISILNSYNVGEWRINATCWDLEDADNSSSIIETFLVKNNEPIIENILFQIEEEDPVEAESVDILNIYRGLDKNLTINVNASNIEGNEMNLTISAADPTTGENLLPNMYVNIPIAVNQTSNFTTNVSFPLTSGLGLTELKIVVLEDEIIQDEYIQEIYIHNNAPILNNFTINDEFGNETSIEEGDWLTFKFGAEDDEDSIDYVVISIFYYDDFGDIQNLNYSTSYNGKDTKISIRAVDLNLKTAIYTVYAYVYDRDGASATCAPQTFAIEASQKVDPTSWLLFVIGIIIGLTFTFVGVYSYYRKKFENYASGDKTTKAKTIKKKHEESVDFEESDEKTTSKPEKESKKKKLIRKL